MPTTIDEARRFVLALPGVTEEPHHQFGSWRVSGRIFATWPQGGTLLHVFLPDDERDLALAMDPACVEPLHWGKTVPGVRVHLPLATPEVVLHLLAQAHAHKAVAPRPARRPAR